MAEKAVTTPIEPGTSLLRPKASPTVYPEGQAIVKALVDKEEEREADQQEYQEIVGSSELLRDSNTT